MSLVYPDTFSVYWNGNICSTEGEYDIHSFSFDLLSQLFGGSVHQTASLQILLIHPHQLQQAVQSIKQLSVRIKRTQTGQTYNKV